MEVDLVEDGSGSGLDPKEHLAMIESELLAVELDIERLLLRQSNLQQQRERIKRAVVQEERAPRKDWARERFPWDATVDGLLHNTFNLSSFRPLQREVINATLQGRDALCLIASGGGKSLIYQLTALVSTGGVTLVVSPLLSLISDQVAHMVEANINAVALTSLSPKEETNAVLKSMDDPSSKLVYCTPERIASSKRFLSKLDKLYKAGRLDRIAIDEAHCCSQWGNDFRPDYKKLGILKEQFPNTPIIALTATATATVQRDITFILNIEDCEVFRATINRPNLQYEVKIKPADPAAVLDDIAAWIKENYPRVESGIVYALTRKDTETVTQELSTRGISAACYHADMDPGLRQDAHTRWSKGNVQVIVATVAFGMGINKPNVRFVLHHTLSKSVDNYYQESGRAGRDGHPARCVLYYRFADYLRQAAVVSMEPGWESHLRGMLAYVANQGACRRGVMCKHFGEAPSACNSMCDVCIHAANTAGAAAGAGASGSASGKGPKDVTELAGKAFNLLTAWPGQEKRATLNQLLDKWKAGTAALGREGAERVIEGLVHDGYLRLDLGFTAYSTNVYLKCTAKASLVTQGRQKVLLHPLPAPTQEATPAVGQKKQKKQPEQQKEKEKKARVETVDLISDSD